MEQGESFIWARIIMHMRHMYIISIMQLLTVMQRIMTRFLSMDFLLN